LAVRLRLTRKGSKRNPHYRIVAQEGRFSRDGRFIEILGHYNPMNYPDSIVLKEEEIKGWLEKGAQPTHAVRKVLAEKGIQS